MIVNNFTERLDAAVEAVAKNYPSAELSSGYIGNITSKYDDRVFYIWSRLRSISKHNGTEFLKWGGVRVDDDEGMKKLAEFAEKQDGLERHIRWTLRMTQL